jgi:hypothetical protein
MAWTQPQCPNLVDYSTWLYTVVAGQAGLTRAILPPLSQVIPDSLQTAQEIVADQLGLGAARPPEQVALTIYTSAVYNLATHTLYMWAPDVAGQTYFKEKREQLGIFRIAVGVTANASDQGTSAGMLNPDQMRTLTFQDLQYLKTPWGRQYMAYAQMYGRTLWGLT